VRGYKAFQAHVRRDAMYRRIVPRGHFWASRTNRRWAWCSTIDLESIVLPLRLLQLRRSNAASRTIVVDSLPFESEHPGIAEGDVKAIRQLFREFLDALAIAEGAKTGVRSPVATAKALHLLAPVLSSLG